MRSCACAQLRGADHRLRIQLLQARDVVRRRVPANSSHLLRQIAHGAAEQIAVAARDVGAVEAHLAGLRHRRSEQQAHQRRLAGGARPDDAEAVAGEQRENATPRITRCASGGRRENQPFRRRAGPSAVAAARARLALHAIARSPQAAPGARGLRPAAFQPPMSSSTGCSARPSRIVAAIMMPGRRFGGRSPARRRGRAPRACRPWRDMRASAPSACADAGELRPAPACWSSQRACQRGDGRRGHAHADHGFGVAHQQFRLPMRRARRGHAPARCAGAWRSSVNTPSANSATRRGRRCRRAAGA
mgnify:CR=1 FL=1